MTDEEANVSTDEGATDNIEDSTVKKPGFFKSKLFLMITGVIVILLIAGGAYYFLIAKEQPETESASDESILENNTAPSSSDDLEEAQSDAKEAEVFEDIAEDNDLTSPNVNELEKTSNQFALNSKEYEETQAKLIEAQKKADVLAEENERMQQQIKALNSQLNRKENVLSQELDSNIIASIQDPNSVDYQQDFFDDSSVHQANQAPPPKPSWGEFNRIKNK